MNLLDWFTNNYIEITGAVTGIIYVYFEIKQKIWLWPLGIITSALYIWIFFESKFYADAGLQFYYLLISVYGWYFWKKDVGRMAEGGGEEAESVEQLTITRLKLKTGLILTLIFAALFAVMWYILDNFTDSPVPGWDSFLTAMSIVATWMLARKILEHWILWIVVDIVSVFVYATKGLYPTVILFIVYSVMAFVGLLAWRREA